MNQQPNQDRRCRACGWAPPAHEPPGTGDHCPNCLAGVHETNAEGYACGGTLLPISVWIRPDERWEIIQRCRLCGEITSSPHFEEDNPILLLSLANRPLSAPPFPLEKMGELTAQMGGQGDLRGYYDEPGA